MAHLTKIKSSDVERQVVYAIMKQETQAMSTSPMIGHNSEGLSITVTVRLFNAMSTHGNPDAVKEPLEYPAGTTVGDIFKNLKLPRAHLFLVLVNGRDVSPGLVGGEPYFNYELEDGDILAFSGPVPYSFGYGAPVV